MIRSTLFTFFSRSSWAAKNTAASAQFLECSTRSATSSQPPHASWAPAQEEGVHRSGGRVAFSPEYERPGTAVEAASAPRRALKRVRRVGWRRWGERLSVCSAFITEHSLSCLVHYCILHCGILLDLSARHEFFFAVEMAAIRPRVHPLARQDAGGTSTKAPRVAKISQSMLLVGQSECKYCTPE